MSAHGWPDAFLAHFTPEQLLTEAYLFSTFSNGTMYCKACGTPFTENREDHLDFHRQELEIRLEERRQDASVRRQEALRAARERKAANHTIVTLEPPESDLGVISDAILGEHGPHCSCEECKEAF